MLTPVENHEVGATSILIIEDAPEFQTLISSALASDSYAVTVANSGREGLELARACLPDVVVLDLGLPDIDGVEVCRELRTFTDAYVIMVTARDEEVDRLVGLAVGADDYLTKPFSVRELAARIQVLLRRPRATAVTAAASFGDLEIDDVGREVHICGESIDLTKIEFDLLSTLCSRPEMVFTREMLIERVWGADWIGNDHIIDVHLANLRKKIDGPSRKCIKTVRGVGYRLNLPSGSAAVS